MYAYFNNDDAGHAVTNAREMRSLLAAAAAADPGESAAVPGPDPAGRPRRAAGAVS